MKNVGTACVVVVAFTLAAAAAFSAGEARQFKVPSRFPEDIPPTKLSVYLPEGYETSGISYPVLYLLHGAGGNDRTFVGDGYAGTIMVDANAAAIVDRLVSEGKMKPLIVACPDLSQHSSSPEDLLSDVVAFVDANLRTIPRRESRAIAGHSMGGTQSVMAPLRSPEMFSIVGSFATYLQGAYLTRPLVLAKKHDQGRKPLRVWLSAGTNDTEGNPPAMQELLTAFRSRGVPVDYIEDDGDHVNRVAQRLADFIVYLSTCLKW